MKNSIKHQQFLDGSSGSQPRVDHIVLIKEVSIQRHNNSLVDGNMKVAVRYESGAFGTLRFPISKIKEFICMPGTELVNVGFAYFDGFGEIYTANVHKTFESWFVSDFDADKDMVLLKMLNHTDFDVVWKQLLINA